MNRPLTDFFENAMSTNIDVAQIALCDLQFLIERCVEERFSNDDTNMYEKIFNDKTLINDRLDNTELSAIKYFLIFLLFNFPDRAALTANCIKALLVVSIRPAICAAIQLYMHTNDYATAELLLVITNVGDIENAFTDKTILELFNQVASDGGTISRERAVSTLQWFRDFIKSQRS